MCASVDVRQHPPVRTLTPKRLAKINSPDNQADAKGNRILSSLARSREFDSQPVLINNCVMSTVICTVSECYLSICNMYVFRSKLESLSEVSLL